MSKKSNVLYLLQVQEKEGTDYKNLYCDTKEDLDNTVKKAQKDKKIEYYFGYDNVPTTLSVFAMRTFKMIKRIKNA